MGMPAARLTDITAHGGTVVSGFPTVLINDLPAARVGDMHVCPMVTGIVPHVGGPFVLGSFTVMVGGVPQSRVTDMLVCVGPPDMLANGSPNVLVGMVGSMGLFGMVVSAILAGLNNLLGTYPKAVVQADGSIATQYNSSITIKGSARYQATVTADLDKFLGTSTGEKWNKAFAATGNKLTIGPIPAGAKQANAYTRAENNNAYVKSDGTANTGSDSTIQYNPSLTVKYKAADGSTETLQPNEALGHEMIHGLHNAQGLNRRANRQDPPYDNEEESQTVGVNGHEDDEITENALESDNGQSNRPNHNSITEAQYQDSSGQWHDTKIDGSGNRTSTNIDPPLDNRPNH